MNGNLTSKKQNISLQTNEEFYIKSKKIYHSLLKQLFYDFKVF